MEDLKVAVKTWKTIYPAYIDSKLTLAEGRRIPKGKAVENPTCEEIAEILMYLKIPHAIEVDKAYPRNWMQKGRVRVMLKDDKGNLANPEITNSTTIQHNRAKTNGKVWRIHTQAQISSRRT